MRAERGPLSLGGLEVIEPVGLETLSIDTKTGTASWKTVSHLFRRRFRGAMLTIRLAGHRVLRTTDRHPMLVVTEDRIEVREARDLKPGDRVPLFNGLTPSAEDEREDPRIDLLANLCSCVHIRRYTYQKRGLSYHHEFNSGQVGYFSSSPELLDQVDALLQGMGLQATRKKGKPHLRVAGRESLLRLAPLLSGDKGDRLGRLDAARLRPGAARAAKPWSEGRTLAVVGVETSPADEFVYSLEVPGTNTFATTGGVFVHNCIPIDPFYLTWVARQHGLTTRFIELAGEINTGMPAYVVGRIADALNDLGKPVKGSKITLLGMAYKKDVDDPRESPGFELMDLLLKKGALIQYNDPHIPTLPAMRHYPHLRMDSQELTPDYLRSQDCLLIVTDHTAYDWPWIAEHAQLIVDTRNALNGVNVPRDRIIRA
ncbi:MAG: UDP binding domain-containing protein [Isosphaeraceae bacterium]